MFCGISAATYFLGNIMLWKKKKFFMSSAHFVKWIEVEIIHCYIVGLAFLISCCNIRQIVIANATWISVILIMVSICQSLCQFLSAQSILMSFFYAMRANGDWMKSWRLCEWGFRTLSTYICLLVCKKLYFVNLSLVL